MVFYVDFLTLIFKKMSDGSLYTEKMDVGRLEIFGSAKIKNATSNIPEITANPIVIHGIFYFF